MLNSRTCLRRLELTWSQKGLRRSYHHCTERVEGAGIDLITEGITTTSWPAGRTTGQRWNWPDHRRDYDHGSFFRLLRATFQAGIDLITEGITTLDVLDVLDVEKAGAGIDLITEGITTTCPCEPVCIISFVLELTWSQKGLRRMIHSFGFFKQPVGWNWPDHRRDYDADVFAATSVLLDAGIDLITEGITTIVKIICECNFHLAGIDLITEGITTSTSPCFSFIFFPAGIDLITEGITTVCALIAFIFSPVLLELTWSQKGLRPSVKLSRLTELKAAGIDLITEGITT